MAKSEGRWPQCGRRLIEAVPDLPATTREQLVRTLTDHAPAGDMAGMLRCLELLPAAPRATGAAKMPRPLHLVIETFDAASQVIVALVTDRIGHAEATRALAWLLDDPGIIDRDGGPWSPEVKARAQALLRSMAH